LNEGYVVEFLFNEPIIPYLITVSEDESHIATFTDSSFNVVPCTISV
jgi:hypothetical protein